MGKIISPKDISPKDRHWFKAMDARIPANLVKMLYALCIINRHVYTDYRVESNEKYYNLHDIKWTRWERRSFRGSTPKFDKPPKSIKPTKNRF